MKKGTFLASLTMVGTIVGAGIFGVPYVFSRAGIVTGLIYLVILGATAIATHGLYGLLAAGTPGTHRLVGYVRLHLGARYGTVAAFSNTLAFLGALLAYIILGGTFLSILFGGTELFWSVAFILTMGLLLALPFKRVEKLEVALTIVLIVTAVAIIALVWRHIDPAQFAVVHPDRWFLPYGVIFFSLGGASAVPEIVDSLGKRRRDIVTATTVGTIVAIVLTGLFGVAVAATTGAHTSPDAIRGLVPVVGHTIVTFGALFGFLAIITSFLTISQNLKEQFEFDFKLSPAASWTIVIGVPAAVYAIGARSFIGVIGFLGAIFGVIDGILIMLMARTLRAPRLRALTYPIILLFLLGFVAEVLTLRR